MYSEQVRDFLLHMSIEDIHYYNFYEELEEEETLHFVQIKEKKIDVIVHGKPYTFCYKFYFNNFEVYGPQPTHIIEQTKNKRMKMDIFDFFNDDESVSILRKCVGRLFQEIEEEFTSPMREWEMQQDHKEKKKLYGRKKRRNKYHT